MGSQIWHKCSIWLTLRLHITAWWTLITSKSVKPPPLVIGCLVLASLNYSCKRALKSMWSRNATPPKPRGGGGGYFGDSCLYLRAILMSSISTTLGTCGFWQLRKGKGSCCPRCPKYRFGDLRARHQLGAPPRPWLPAKARAVTVPYRPTAGHSSSRSSRAGARPSSFL